MTLTEFLLARIAEDEADADTIHEYGCDTFQVFPCDCTRPARVLAECEAKRRIAGMSWDGRGDSVEWSYTNEDFGYDKAWTEVLSWLALPYATHPDYREDWAPGV